MKKILIILSLLFLGQFLLSCHDDCRGTDSSKYDIIYNGVAMNPAKIMEGTSYQVLASSQTGRADFGLEAITNYNLKEVGMLLPQTTYGFTSAIACSPVSPEYFCSNLIINFELFVIDTQTDEKTNITSSFLIRNYSNQWLSIKDFFEQTSATTFSQNYDIPLLFKLNQYDTTPQNSVFSIEAHLESGDILSQSSKEIYFNE